MSISKSIRRSVAEICNGQCGYCQTQEAVSGIRLTIEHIIAKARGGTDAEQNLWQSCRLCNEAKGIQIEAIDPETGQSASLFNPRTQQWALHFQWSKDGTVIIGLTATGRATIQALALNDPFRTRTRAIWVESGWHPPK